MEGKPDDFRESLREVGHQGRSGIVLLTQSLAVYETGSDP